VGEREASGEPRYNGEILPRAYHAHQQVYAKNHFGRTAGKDRRQIGSDSGMGGCFLVATGIGELQLDRVATEAGSSALLLETHVPHLFISKIQKRPNPRRACTIGNNDTAESFFVGLVEAVAYAVMDKDLDIILMRGNT